MGNCPVHDAWPASFRGSEARCWWHLKSPFSFSESDGGHVWKSSEEALEQAIARFRVISLDKVTREDLSPLGLLSSCGTLLALWGMLLGHTERETSPIKLAVLVPDVNEDQVATSQHRGSTTDLCLQASGLCVGLLKSGFWI